MADKAEMDAQNKLRDGRYYKRRKKITILSSVIGLVSGLIILGIAAFAGGLSAIWGSIVLLSIVGSFYATGRYLLDYTQALLVSSIAFIVAAAIALTIEVVILHRQPPMLPTFLGIILVPILGFLNAFVAIHVEDLEQYSYN